MATPGLLEGPAVLPAVWEVSGTYYMWIYPYKEEIIPCYHLLIPATSLCCTTTLASGDTAVHGVKGKRGEISCFLMERVWIKV